LTTRTTSSITGTSISTPTTVASAAPESKPNRLMAAATASSKKLLAPISADGQATQCASPEPRGSASRPAGLKNTWIRIGTASSAITSGCCRMASPWKANSSTSVSSSAAIDHGPSQASAAKAASGPRRSSARRQSCARITGTRCTAPPTSAACPRARDRRQAQQQADDGREGEHHDGVVQRHLATA
jgi:hypothetical protein